MQKLSRLLLSAALIACLPVPVLARDRTATAETALIDRVDIPYERFTLPNGLRVIVHTDRKAPIVATQVWYHVGSKDEPKGRTGFAHLFEHLMFEGSAHVKDFDKALEDAGASGMNGTTWFDRTNYFQTVPSSALELALFLESDRMGHLLPAITQTNLDQQRGVVQNEKRQGDNRPFGLVQYRILDRLFPDGHGYRHSTIGSLADLDAASLADVKQWFSDWYGPNNAVLVLAGDIDAATARPLVEKYFGSFKPSPPQPRLRYWLPEHRHWIRETMQDRVSNARVYRAWVAPPRTDSTAAQLDVAATILGGGASSRLYNDLVRDRQLATSVSAYVQAYEAAGMMQIVADVKPGVDPAVVEARIDDLVADFLAKGPTSDEVSRVAMRAVAGTIRSLEDVGGYAGKAATLAEGELLAGDPAFFKTELKTYANATPKSVHAAARAWMTRGGYALTVTPFGQPRPESADADRSALPAPGTVPDLSFPHVERARLSNGIPVTLARRSTVPVVEVSMLFDAGIAADDKAKPGLSTLTLSLLDEGTTRRSATEIAEEAERLGANIGASSDTDSTRMRLSALKSNLAASLDLYADVLRNPAFLPREIERLRAIQLVRIAQEADSPQALALRELPPLLYGRDHPYGVSLTGSGTTEGVQAITRADLVAFHQRWLRPDNAQLFIVGDTSMAEILPLLEKHFGNWAATGDKGQKQFRMAEKPQSARIILIDRPGAPQSFILAGQPLAVTGRDDPLALMTANEILGGSFIARINNNLRETRGWSYGAYSRLSGTREQIPFLIQAPVQTDRTVDAIKEIMAELAAFLGPKGVTPEELTRTLNGNVRALPGAFEGSGDVLAALERNAVLGRADDYQIKLASRYRALTAAELDAAADRHLDPARLIWVIVGDRSKVEAPLRAAGLGPVEVR